MFRVVIKDKTVELSNTYCVVLHISERGDLDACLGLLGRK